MAKRKQKTDEEEFDELVRAKDRALTQEKDIEIDESVRAEPDAVMQAAPVEFGGETSEVGDALPRATSAVTSAVGDLFSWSREGRVQAEQSLRESKGGSDEYREPEEPVGGQQQGQQQDAGSDVSEERMDDLLGWGEQGVDLYDDFETDMRARPGRQETAQAGDLSLTEKVGPVGAPAPGEYGLHPGQTTEQTASEVGGNALITDLKPGSREGAAEGPMKFAGETGYTTSGKHEATDAQMMEAMGGPMSQEDIDSFNQMIRNQKISNRMEAGDYEGMGAAEFSEAMQGEGMPESGSSIVDSWQAAEEARRPGAELPEDAPETAKMTNKMARDMLEQGMSQEEVGQMLGYISPQIKQQQKAERLKDIQEMEEEGEFYQTLIEEGEGQGGSEGQGQGQGEETPFPDIGPEDSAELTKQGIDELRRTMSPEEFDKLSDEDKRKMGQRLILKQYRNFQNMAGGNQNNQGSSEFSDILG